MTIKGIRNSKKYFLKRISNFSKKTLDEGLYMANMQVLLKQVAKKLASLLKFPIFFKTFIPKNTYEKFHLKGIQVVQLRSVYKTL